MQGNNSGSKVQLVTTKKTVSEIPSSNQQGISSTNQSSINNQNQNQNAMNSSNQQNIQNNQLTLRPTDPNLVLKTIIPDPTNVQPTKEDPEEKMTKLHIEKGYSIPMQKVF